MIRQIASGGAKGFSEFLVDEEKIETRKVTQKQKMPKSKINHT